MGCLYAAETATVAPQNVLTLHLAREKLSAKNRAFVTVLFEQVRANTKTCDGLIARHLKHWDIARLSLIDRLVMHLAICEFLFFPDIPFRVTINEAVELAKKFSTGDSGAFVNGVLDAIAKTIEQKTPAGTTAQ